MGWYFKESFAGGPLGRQLCNQLGILGGLFRGR